MITNVCVLVDWSQAFVDSNGSFYGGATMEEKNKAIQLIEQSNTIIYFTDVHSTYSTEFIQNGGIYPTHNLVDNDLTTEDVNQSARLTEPLQQKIKEKQLKSGIVIPNNVIYQSREHPIPVEHILNTFDNIPRITTPEDNDYNYIISCKHFFNGTGMQRLPFGNVLDEFTGATLLQYKYGYGEGIRFLITGVVTGICIIHTAAGLKQMFPKAEIIIVKDACHPLIGEQFGITSIEDNDHVVAALAKQINISYKSLDEL